MKHTLIAAAIFAALSAQAQDKKAPPMKEQVAATKKKLTESFLDPDTAKFRNVVGYGIQIPNSTPGLITLCGEVNGKNAYGAYTGFKRFYAIAFGLVSKIESDDSALAAYDTACKGEVVFKQP